MAEEKNTILEYRWKTVDGSICCHKLPGAVCHKPWQLKYLIGRISEIGKAEQI